MNWKDYKAPVILGLISFVLSIIFKANILTSLQSNNFSNEIFTVSALLFGLVLTSYSILFGILPSMKKDLKNSQTMKDINFYFRSCLFILLLGLMVTIIYLFYEPYWMFILTITLLGSSIGFFHEIIFLINDIFNEIHQEDA